MNSPEGYTAIFKLSMPMKADGNLFSEMPGAGVTACDEDADAVSAEHHSRRSAP
jgi:hypothetical protein